VVLLQELVEGPSNALELQRAGQGDIEYDQKTVELHNYFYKVIETGNQMKFELLYKRCLDKFQHPQV